MSNLIPAPKSATQLQFVADLSQPLTLNPAAVYLASLGASSRRTMRGSLDTIAALVTQGQQTSLEFAWHQLRYQHTSAIRTALMENYAPATANKHLAALRRVLKEAWRLELIGAEDYRKAADVANIKNETLPAGRALSAGEIERLVQVCAADHSPAGKRDLAMLGILRSGLRREEVVKLDLADVDLEDGSLRIQGKGRKERSGYLTQGAIVALRDWLEIRGSEPGALLLPVSKTGKIQSRRLSDQAVLYVLQRRAEQAKIAHCSPHDLRRTFVTHLFDAGVDVETVQKLMGHNSPETTIRYSKRGEDAKKKAVGLLGF